MQLSDRYRLFYLYLREGWRRFSRRMSVGRISALRFSGSAPDRLIVAPTDLRSVDSFVAEEILVGRFALAGRVLETEGQSPFSLELPSREFAMRLHSFGWLRHMRALANDEAPSGARSIVDEWISSHGRVIGGLAWNPDVLAQRIIAWLSHSPVVLKDAEFIFFRRFLKSLAFQVRYLRHIADRTEDGETRLRIRIALALASIAMPARTPAIRRASRNLDRELDSQILADGGHCSRNPRAGLELLLDLLPLRQTYVNLGHDVPARLIPCIDRMYPALRFFRHQGGELALFNGATSTLANELMSVLRYDETAGAPFRSMPSIHYERLSAGETVVLVDTGKPLSVALSATASAGCLSFEMSSGKHRFIINSGMPKFAGESLRQLSRATAAHSVATLNDTSSARMSRSAFLGPIMISGVSKVDVRRNEPGSDADGLTATHDGYVSAFGLLYERDFHLNAQGTVLRGTERFHKPDGSPPAGTHNGIAVVRFHVHPAIRLRKSDRGEIWMTAPDGESWVFFTRDADVEIEEDVFFADPSGIRPSNQIALAFAVAEMPEIQWILTRQQ